MKTVKNLMLAIALLLLVNNSIFATRTNINVIGDKTFVLSVETPSSTLSINLVDENNMNLYSEEVKNLEGDFKAKFNLSSLPDGVYELEIEDISKVTTHLLKIKNDKIISNEITTESSLKPTIFVRNEMLLVIGLASKKSPINVNIYNSENVLAYEASLVDDSKTNRIFKFNYTGNYTINLYSNGKTYSYNVNVKTDSKTKNKTLSIK